MSDAHATAVTAKLGPVNLVPGVSRLNAWAYLVSAFAGVAITSFLSVIMPYVLTNNLGLPQAEQGRVAGDLVFYGEIILLTMSGVFGAWSDMFGRRMVFVGGLILLAVGYSILGFVTTLASLIALRVFMTFGIAAVSVMISTVQVDYPQEESRGKLVGFAGIAIGVGAVMLGIVLAPLPQRFSAAGYDEVMSGRLTMFTMTLICMLAAVVVRFGLLGGRPPNVAEKTSTRKLLVDGVAAAKRNPLILLAYGSAFVGRADLVVVGTFYSLWMNHAALAAGMTASEAQGSAGMMFAMVMTAALVSAPVLGWLNDRLDRSLAMGLALALAAFGYAGMGLVPDPQAGWIYPASILLGIGQMAVTLASQTLIGQESPAASRGAIVGTFSVCGAAGILFVTSIGGRLYDNIDPSAPFVLIGFLNGLLAVLACVLFFNLRNKRAIAAASA